MLDFILNGQGYGDVAAVLLANNGDINALRPFVDDDGHTYVNRFNPITNEIEVVPVANATATLRKDVWIDLDNAVIEAAKPRLKFVGDIRGAGLVRNVPNGMGTTVLQWERQSDMSPAVISMDGIRQSDGDRPYFDLQSMPLPIIHKDFDFTLRQVLASQGKGQSIDTTGAALAGRLVAEEAEKLALGSLSTYRYAGGYVYGLKNFPQRNTKTITAPTTPGWTPAKTVQEVLEMRKQSQDDNMYGDWMLYCSTDWDVYMDDDYSQAKGANTLRRRLQDIKGLRDVRTLDYLSGWDLILVQMTPDNFRMVIGMDMITVRWESHGGMQLNFKVMTIMVPQVRADITEKSGIVHGGV